MINSNKIDEWIREAEERPTSAAVIIRYIANRLSELTGRNEELLAENIELRSGRKVEEYESRITNLEYQVELLKRQLGREAALPGESQAALPAQDTTSLILFNSAGQVLRLEIHLPEFASRQTIAQFAGSFDSSEALGLRAASSQEELLFVFDSGRTVTQPVSALPVAESRPLDWQGAALIEPRGLEELVAVLPVARMSLYDFCIQTSRRGYVKKIRQDFFVNYVSEGYVGTGVKLPADKTCCLTLCGKDDRIVLASREGFLISIEAGKLPLTIEEVIRLGATDHIITAFSTSGKPSFLVMTNNGKIIHREVGWLEPAASFKGRGQPVYSQERRAAGVRIAGAALVDENDWGITLQQDGQIKIYALSDLFSIGSLFPAGEQNEVNVFTVLEGLR